MLFRNHINGKGNIVYLIYIIRGMEIFLTQYIHSDQLLIFFDLGE